MNYHNRHLEKELVESLAFYKDILLVGARQVGKTTLLRHAFPDFRMITFDPVQISRAMCGALWTDRKPNTAWAGDRHLPGDG